MTKRNETPVQPAPKPAPVLAGGAKASTNAGGGSTYDEDPPVKQYDD